MRSFEYSGYAQDIVFEAGAVEQLESVVDRFGWRRVLLCTSGSQRRNGHAARVESGLGARRLATFDGVRQHVQEEQVNEFAATARDLGVDAIVALGGGSVLGIAKAVSDVLHEASAGYPGRQAGPLEPAQVPTIAIPTTYAGSEMTTVYGVTRVVDGVPRKLTVSGRNVVPRVVVYDPPLTVDLPAELTTTSAMNALAHCFEALYSIRRNPLSTSVALGGIRAIGASLPRCYADGRDLDARSRLLEGAFLAGTALSQVAMAIHHGVCHVLGGTAGVPHGVANSIVLPHALKFNREAAARDLASAAVVLGLSGIGDDPVRSTGALIDWMDGLVAEVDLPTRLRDYGVKRDDLPELARIAFDGGPVKYNPRPVRDASEIEELLRTMW
jgi:alcohol dehydrogenase class IV